MGVATITTVKADGLYEVQVLKNLEQAEIRKTELIAFIDTLTTKISELNLKLPPLQVTKAELQVTIAAAIAANAAKPPPKPLVKYEKEEKELNEVSGKIQDIQEDIAEKTIQKKTAEKRKDEIEIALSDVDTRDLWCLDYDVEIGLGDTVITVELNQESENLLIAPRTYSPVMADVDLLTAKQTAIDALVAEFDLAISAANAEIANIKAQVAAKEAEIVVIAASIPQNPTKNPAIQAVINKKIKEMDVISQAIQSLAVKSIAEVKKLNKATLKKGQQLNKKAEIQKKATDLLAAIDDIFIPVPDQYTRWLQPTISSGGSAVFFNQGLLPGVQRWQPTYRKGTIVAVYTDTDTADVYILPAISGQKNSLVQSMGINKTGSSGMDLLAVPVRYGRCNSAVFEAGDSVIVDFQGDWETPVVIGFADHPKECGGGFVYERDVAGTITKMLLPEDKSLTGSIPNHLFAAEDHKFNGFNFGQVDWTDHSENQISWRGTHRYTGIGSDLSIFKSSRVFDLTKVKNTAGTELAGIVGVVAGAAFIDKKLIAFVFDTDTLHYYFIQDNKVSHTGTIGTYLRLTQCVAVSPNCTKASFIAVPIDQEGLQTVVIDMTIVVATGSVTISNTQTQDVSDPIADYEAGIVFDPLASVPLPTPDESYGSIYARGQIYSNAYDSGVVNVIVAVDYDKTNTRQVFFVETEYSCDFYRNVAPTVTGIPTAEVKIDTSITQSKIATVNYNGIVTATSNSTLSGSGFFYVGKYHVTPDDTYNPEFTISANSTEYQLIFIDALDLRYELFAYTKQVETTDEYKKLWDFNCFISDVWEELDHTFTLIPWDPPITWDGTIYIRGDRYTTNLPYIDNKKDFSIHREHWLKIGAYSYKFKADYDFSGDFNVISPDNKLNGVDYPLYEYCFINDDIIYDFVVAGGYSGYRILPKFSVKIQYEAFIISFGSDFYSTQVSSGIDENHQRNHFSLTDKFDNKLIKSNTIIGWALSSGLNVDDTTIIKIDRNNTLYSQAITDLKGIM